MTTTATPVAIVGMSVLLPGAPDLDTDRHNTTTGVDAITEVDQIVVLEHGSVRARGTHRSLVDDDLYRELASTQLLADAME